MVEKYVQECELMSSLRHPNITQFLGLCFLPAETQLPLLVMELLETSLDDLLEHVPNLHLSLKRSVLEDIASGLLYLHERQPSPVIHRDLTARNVLLTSSLVAKITDMGNSRIIDALDDKHRYGPSLDIFSFGHLALFTILQKFPGDLLPSTFPDPENLGAVQGRTEVERRKKYIDLLELEVLCSNHPSLIQLVKQCLHNVPNERPNTDELLIMLQRMKVEVEGEYGGSPIRLDMLRVKLAKEVKMERELTRLRERHESQQEGMTVDSGRQNQELLSEITRKEEEIVTIRREVATKDEVIATKERDLARKDELIATKERDIARKDELIANKERDIVSKDEQMVSKERNIARKDQQIASNERDIVSKDEQIASNMRDIVSKDEQIAAKERDIARKDKQIVAKEKDIATKERDIATKDRDLASKECDLVSKDEQIAATSRELAATRREVANKDEQLANKDTLIQQLKNRIEELQQRETQQTEEQQQRDDEIRRLREELRREKLPLQFPLQLKWRSGAYMPLGMVGYVQSVVVKGRLYLGGGHVENDGDDDYVIMEYDISSGKWAKLPPYRVCHFAMAVIENQLVLVGGEQHRHCSKVLGVWRPESKEWAHPYPDMSIARSFCSAVGVDDEWLAVAGGVEDSRVRLASVEVINVVSKQWYAAPSTPMPWSSMKTAIVGDTCYFMGGFVCHIPTTEVYSVSLQALLSQLRSQDSRGRGKQHQIWNVIPALVTTHSTPLSIGGDYLFAVGGKNKSHKPVSTIHLYQPDSGEWVKVEDVPTPRCSCTCTMVRDRDILVTGGQKSHNFKDVNIAVIMS